MLKKKKEAVEKEVKAYVGDKTLKGVSKLTAPVLKGVGYITGGIVSAFLIFKTIKKKKEK